MFLTTCAVCAKALDDDIEAATSTFEMSPDAQLVGYLSQHTTHAILQAKPEIDALMAK